MIEILSSSALATVQDQGREGCLRYGVGTAGAMDRLALAIGNLLLGNPDDAAGIEIPMFPFRIRFLDDLDFAITGADCSARLGDKPVLPWWTRHAKTGDVLTIGVPANGTRCYLSHRRIESGAALSFAGDRILSQSHPVATGALVHRG